MNINNKISALFIGLFFCFNSFANETPTLKDQIQNIYEQGKLPTAGVNLNTLKEGYQCIMSNGETSFSIRPSTYKLLISDAQPAIPNKGPLQPGRAEISAVYAKPIEIMSFQTNYSEELFSFSAATAIYGLNSILVSKDNKTEQPISMINKEEQAIQTSLNGSSYGKLSVLFSLREFKDSTSLQSLLALKMDWSLEASRCEIQCSDLADNLDDCLACQTEHPGSRIKEYQDYGYCWKK